MTIRPNYPFVLVERLPREIKSESGIVLTDSNKPVHDGVVKAVWAPWDKLISADCDEFGRPQQRRLKMVCAVNVGDIVVFHHSAGFVHDPTDENVSFVDEKAILGAQEPDGEKAAKILLAMLHDLGAFEVSNADIVRRIQDEFILVHRAPASQSGGSVNGAY